VQNYVLLKTTRKQNIFGRQYRVLGQALPVLFPIVGTLKKIYINIRIKPIIFRHGFARDIIFELIDKRERAFSIIGCDKKQYFDFQLKLTIHWKTTAYPLHIKWSTKPITAAFLYRGILSLPVSLRTIIYSLR
jgi:hypothetical protein